MIYVKQLFCHPHYPDWGDTETYTELSGAIAKRRLSVSDVNRAKQTLVSRLYGRARPQKVAAHSEDLHLAPKARAVPARFGAEFNSRYAR